MKKHDQLTPITRDLNGAVFYYTTRMIFFLSWIPYGVRFVTTATSVLSLRTLFFWLRWLFYQLSATGVAVVKLLEVLKTCRPDRDADSLPATFRGFKEAIPPSISRSVM